MSPLPFTDPRATVVFCVAFAVFVAVEVRVVWLSRRSRPAGRADRSLRVVTVCFGAGIGGGFALAVTAPGAAVSAPRAAVFVAGIVLMLLGTAVRQWAITVLGRWFTVDVRVRAGQTVIDGGPYRWVRHPSYTAGLITFAGLGLALGNWLTLAVVTLVPLAGYLIRIRVEEAVLLAELGEPYRHYAATRARLIPGLW